MTFLIIYLIGYVFSWIQHTINDGALTEKPRTNGDILLSFVFSFLSWLWFLIALGVYLEERHDISEKFKKWSKKEVGK